MSDSLVRKASKLCIDCKAEPRQSNSAGNFRRRCSGCQWKHTKARPERHAVAKAANRRACAAFRKTPKRKVALKRYASTPQGKASALRERRRPRSGRAMRRLIWCSITVEEWFAVASAQGWRCPICLDTIYNPREQPGSVGQAGQVEHLHSLEDWLVAGGVDPIVALRRSIRGIACSGCNLLLGPFVIRGRALNDDAGKARRAADYLEHAIHTAQAHIALEPPASLHPMRYAVDPFPGAVPQAIA